MAHLQYIPGDPRLVDQLVYELKSKGIFDQFRKDCIADVDTRPAYQNLRQRVENSVSSFLSRQSWQPDLNKNQLREKLRKHILDGNYLEQGVERIVDQVVNPKVASIFIPQVEDLVYNYLGISRKKLSVADTSNEQKTVDLLPNDLEAVSPGSVNNDDKEAVMDIDEKPQVINIQNDQEKLKSDIKNNLNSIEEEEKIDESQLSSISDLTPQDSNLSIDKENIPFPPEEIVVENIPPPENSPPKVELDKIELPKETSTDIPLPEEMSVDIPLPDEITEKSKEQYFKPINTDDDDSSSDSSLRRNMSPLTPIRNYNNENSCDAQQAFENNSFNNKNEDKKEPSSFRFTIETKSSENSCDVPKTNKDKKDTEANLSYQFNNQVNINHFNTPTYEDSSNSHNLQIDYESDANSKVNNIENKVVENEQNSEDSKKEKKDEKKSTNKSSHRSRDSLKHSSSSRDKRSDLKQSSSRDSSRHDKSKSSKDDKSRSYDKEKSKEKGDKKDSKESSRHRSSHKSSHKDSKSHRSSSSSYRHSSKHSDDKRSSTSSSQKDKDKAFDKEKNTKDKSRDSRCNSHRSDKDRKNSSSNSKSKLDDKDKMKKNKKETDDHYGLSGRGNPNRRSTDRDSNDGSSSSKGSNNPPSSKSSQTKTDSKKSSKIDTTSTSGDSTSPSDKENIAFESGTQARELLKHKPIVRIEKNLETPVVSPPRLPFVPDVTIRKPKIAANFEEAKKVMKMRKFLEDEQRRMNQEAVLLLEFQANVRPSLSQVYSSISGPELEFACVTNTVESHETSVMSNEGLQIEKHVQEHLECITESPENEHALDTTDEIKLECEVQENEAPIPKYLDVADKEDNMSEKNGVHGNEDEKKCQTKFFEVTIITEELSESEETQNSDFIKQEAKADIIDESKHIDLSETEKELKYFAEHEKYDAELERAKYSKFFKNIYQIELSNKLYLINCDAYTENIFREASKEFGDFNIVNYHRNGHLKINNPKTVKNFSTEVSLPIDINYDTNDSESVQSLSFNSPQKFECSFELTSDYNKKLEEMVSKTSRQEIMEIILGSSAEDSSNMPTIDYCTESNIDLVDDRVKRKYCDVDYSMNNNDHILRPNKMRKLSSDHISSTTQEVEEPHCILTNTRSKYLGRPGRVGLPKPRRTTQGSSDIETPLPVRDFRKSKSFRLQEEPRSGKQCSDGPSVVGSTQTQISTVVKLPDLQSSPSSDKSVENYEQNTPTQTVNGKMKPRNVVQRYDTTDLYKPKLHYLSKRNNIT